MNETISSLTCGDLLFGPKNMFCRYFLATTLLVSLNSQSAELVCTESEGSNGDNASLTLRYVDGRLTHFSLQTVRYPTPELEYPCDVSASLGDGETVWTYGKDVTEIAYTLPFSDEPKRYPKVFVTSSTKKIVITHDVPFVRFCGNQSYLPSKVTYVKKSRKCTFE